MPTKTQHSSLADYLLSEIRYKLLPNQSLAKVLESDMGLGHSAAYKRLRGEVAFSTEELMTLAQRFGVSLDAWVFREQGSLSFQFQPLVSHLAHPRDFLAGLEQRILKLLELPAVKVYYATAEIPGFQHLVFPELSAFKLYMWNRTSWEIPVFAKPNFHPDMFIKDAETERLRLSVLQLWNSFPSEEFWTSHMLDNTLSQLCYMAYDGSFADPDTAAMLGSQLLSLVDIWEEMADTGLKPPIENASRRMPFTLCHNEITHTNNTFFVASPHVRQALLTVDNPQVMSTTDPAFCTYIESWIDKIRHRSLRISVEGEKHRKKYFNALRQKVNDTLQEIDTLGEPNGGNN